MKEIGEKFLVLFESDGVGLEERDTEMDIEHLDIFTIIFLGLVELLKSFATLFGIFTELFVLFSGFVTQEDFVGFGDLGGG